jgi:hypothetical protein
MSAEKLLDLINNAKQSDLDEVDEQITAARSRLDGLTALRKMLAVRIEGAQPRKQRSSASGSTEGDERRRKIAKYLLSAGPTKMSTLAAHVGAGMQGFHFVLKHAWFSVSGEIAQLTQEGKNAAAKL